MFDEIGHSAKPIGNGFSDHGPLNITPHQLNLRLGPPFKKQIHNWYFSDEILEHQYNILGLTNRGRITIVS